MSDFLNRSISRSSCLLGWAISTFVFVCVVSLLGGPAKADTYESVFSTWAIAHGRLDCAFPSGYRIIAPLYPLLSGGIAALGHIGNAVAFPQPSAMGQHCDRAFLAINQWSLRANALNRTVDVAYVSWLCLMTGLIAVLRVVGRGRRMWEPATLIVVALMPPVWMCVESTFHPEDLIAMGFALIGVACGLRGSWTAAGVFMVLAFFTQQYSILIAIPLLFIAPTNRRASYVLSAMVTWLVFAIPLLIVSSQSATRSLFLGTAATGGVGGALLWEIGFHGRPLLVFSRVAPIALSAWLSWWTARRLGRSVVQPPVVISLVSISLALRLVFEQQFFSYYVMALAVSLILLDVIRSHIRASLIAWLAIVSLWGLTSDGGTALDLIDHSAEPIVKATLSLATIALGAMFIALNLRSSRPKRMVVAGLALVAGAITTWHRTDVVGVPPTWLWQVALVFTGIALAAGPLLKELSAPQRGAEAVSSPGEELRSVS